MKKDEEPRVYIERSVWQLAAFVLASIALDFTSLQLLMRPDPFGILLIIPGIILTIQTLWLVLHPFARVYPDKVEIRRSFIHHFTAYFIDLKSIASRKGRLYITYNDDEVALLRLGGIRGSHRELLREAMERQLSENLQLRESQA